MKDLSIAQEFLLCVLTKKGKFPIIGYDKSTCFVASALLELLSNGFIKINDKKVVIVKNLDQTFDYLLPMYDHIKNSKPKTLKNIASDFIITFSSKNLKQLIGSVNISLVEEDCVYEIKRKGFLGKEKTYFIPKKDEIENIVQKIRAELLEDGTITDETIGLVSLLNKCRILKQYFSKFESKRLKQRLTEIKSSAPNKVIKEMLDFIDSIMATVIIASSSSR